MRKPPWKVLNYKPWRERATRCARWDSVRHLPSSLIWLPTDNGRNALSSPRNKEARARNSSWLVFLSSLRTQLAGQAQTSTRTSMWNAFKTEAVHAFPLASIQYSRSYGPFVCWATSTGLFFSPLHSSNNSLESLRQLTWGQTENLVLPFNLHLRNQIKIQLLSPMFYLHFCLCSRKLEKKESERFQ